LNLPRRFAGRPDTHRIKASAALLIGLALLTFKSLGEDWPMLGHDAARSGGTTQQIRPSLARKWYRLFPDEGLQSGVRPVIEQLMRNEAPFQLPTTPLEIFTARALILAEPAEKLQAFIDLPWCRADEFYIQKLALTLRALQN
jgi:hypothetical protein